MIDSSLLSIVIIHWNTPAALERQLTELKDIHDCICVVNNGGDTTRLERSFPRVTFYTNKHNQGFGKAGNSGSYVNSSKYILFLNTDVHISIAEIEALLTTAKQQSLSALSPTLITPNGEIDPRYQKDIPSFMSLLWEFTPLNRLGQFPFSQGKTLPGACLLIKRSIFEQLGGWDERYFVWFEDSRLSLQLLNQHQPFTVTSQRVIHQGALSFDQLQTEKRTELFFLSMRQFIDQNLGSIQKWILNWNTRRFSHNVLLSADSQIELSLVVPNMQRPLLEKFLEQQLHLFTFTKHELIIVTSVNDITDLRQKYPEVVFICLEQNKGFAHTVNLGFRRARGKYIGTINDDTFAKKSWFEPLVEYLEQHPQKKIGSIAPQVLKPNKEVESLGITVLPKGKAKVLTTANNGQSIDANNAAAVIYNRGALEEVGLYDERFGSYLEDIDLGLRMKKRGWQHLALPEVEITHIGQQTSRRDPSQKAWQDTKNWWLLTLKHTTAQQWLTSGWAIVIERARNLSGFIKTLNSVD